MFKNYILIFYVQHTIGIFIWIFFCFFANCFGHNLYLQMQFGFDIMSLDVKPSINFSNFDKNSKNIWYLICWWEITAKLIVIQNMLYYKNSKFYPKFAKILGLQLLYISTPMSNGVMNNLLQSVTSFFLCFVRRSSSGNPTHASSFVMH